MFWVILFGVNGHKTQYTACVKSSKCFLKVKGLYRIGKSLLQWPLFKKLHNICLL